VTADIFHTVLQADVAAGIGTKPSPPKYKPTNQPTAKPKQTNLKTFRRDEEEGIFKWQEIGREKVL